MGYLWGIWKKIGNIVYANSLTVRFLPLALGAFFVPNIALAQGDGQTALSQCLELAGAPDNSLPASEEMLASLRVAAPFCDQALAQGQTNAQAHFLMGILQQSEGALATAMDHFRAAAWLAMQSGTSARANAPATVAAPKDEVISQAANEAQGENGAEVATVVSVEVGDMGEEAVPVPSAPEPESALSEPVPEPAPEQSAGPTLQKGAQGAEPQAQMGVSNAEADSAVAQCATLAGEPDSGVPVSPAALEASLAALRLAEPFCQQAIAEGSATAETHFQLAVLLQHEGKHEAALKHFRKAAEMGLAAAHSKLGDYALFGIGPVKADIDEAVAQYRLAADAGDLAATTTLAFLYRLGRGVPRDPAQMMALLTKAADGGYQFAQYRLAQTYLTGDGIAGGADAALGVPNPELGAKYLKMAARQGNSKAILELAQLYADDAGGIAWDMEAHAYWTRKAAETGDPAAIGALGLLYEKGRGVEKDPQRAAELYVQALESGKLSFDDLRKGALRRAPEWDRGTAVAFQLILQERGLYEGAIDGVIGPMSARAARALGR